MVPSPEHIVTGNFRDLARAITLIENEWEGAPELLASLSVRESVPIVGITGPPGSGKSTLTDALIGLWVAEGFKVAVLCVDPSSPFHTGALLGDRIRMSQWFLNPSVFIRSLSTRGTLGGLHPQMVGITELLKSAPFDLIVVETAGVGQSEVQITGLADLSLVVLVPGSGDEVQAMKSGLMEIGDLYIVNRGDDPASAGYAERLKTGLHSFEDKRETPILIISAINGSGIPELHQAIGKALEGPGPAARRKLRLLERAYQLLAQRALLGIDRKKLESSLLEQQALPGFNLFGFLKSYPL